MLSVLTQPSEPCPLFGESHREAGFDGIAEKGPPSFNTALQIKKLWRWLGCLNFKLKVIKASIRDRTKVCATHTTRSLASWGDFGHKSTHHCKKIVPVGLMTLAQ